MKGTLMVCGTASDVGKSALVTAFCRWLTRHGVSVAPFKAQNMALNSYVTSGGGEIGRAQAAQAMAAGIEPEVLMNPVLLKPTQESISQVVVMGEPDRCLDARQYQKYKATLMPVVVDAFEELRSRFDVVIAEGAGSPAEINLAQDDIVNLGFARRVAMPALIVGDIDRGGVFASLFGTVELLPPQRRELVKGFVVNKFRGDRSLLDSGYQELLARTGIPTLGTLPYRDHVAIDEEDSLALNQRMFTPRPETNASLNSDVLDIAVVRLPRISNFTDFDPLSIEPSVRVRYVDRPQMIGDPDLLVIPGTKNTGGDLGFLRSSGLADGLLSAHRNGSVILGICGGYQMLGRTIIDEVESGVGEVDGLGLLDAATVFEHGKITRRRTGYCSRWSLGSPALEAYEIHSGRTKVGDGCIPFAELADVEGGLTESEGAVSVSRRVYGTNLHGFLESDECRSAFLYAVAQVRSKLFSASGSSFAAHRQDRFDSLADLVEEFLDMGRVAEIIESGNR